MGGRKNCSKAKILIFFWAHTISSIVARKKDVEEVKPIVENIVRKEKPDLIFLEGQRTEEVAKTYRTILPKELLERIYGKEWRKRIEFEGDVALKYANEECKKELGIGIEKIWEEWECFGSSLYHIKSLHYIEKGESEKAREAGREYLKCDYVFHFYREKGIIRRIEELAKEYKKILIIIGAMHLPLWYELEDAGFEVQAYRDVKQFYPLKKKFLKKLRKRYRRNSYPCPLAIGISSPLEAIYVEERARGTKVKEFWRKVEEKADRKSDVVEKKYDLEIFQEIFMLCIRSYLSSIEKTMSLREINRICYFHAYLIDEEIVRETFKRIRERLRLERKIRYEKIGSIVVQLLKEKGRWKGERILRIEK